MKGKIIGKITQIAETLEVTDTFKKREFLIKTIEEFPNFYKLEFIQDKVELLDGFKEGDLVKVSCNLQGREYTSKEDRYDVFMSLKAWNIELA